MEKIGIIGLGYVGLPLAVEFGKVMDVVGFDINQERINELKKGLDRTKEVESDELKSFKKINVLFRFTRFKISQLLYCYRSNSG
jgi:UDP-N-acetyl-D-galactosamine dehydrogenase